MYQEKKGKLHKKRKKILSFVDFFILLPEKAIWHKIRMIMKRLLLVFFATILMTAQQQITAQNEMPAANEHPDTTSVSPIRFGFFSYEEALKAMPEYGATQDSIKAVREAFEKEVKRVEDEFNQKYEAFLDGQRDFPRTILLKRQNELQELLQRNVAFKVQARQELQEAETALMKPLRQRLDDALIVIAHEYGLALILNTDSNACPFIEPSLSMNVQKLVEEYLQ